MSPLIWAPSRVPGPGLRFCGVVRMLGPPNHFFREKVQQAHLLCASVFTVGPQCSGWETEYPRLKPSYRPPDAGLSAHC